MTVRSNTRLLLLAGALFAAGCGTTVSGVSAVGSAPPGTEPGFAVPTTAPGGVGSVPSAPGATGSGGYVGGGGSGVAPAGTTPQGGTSSGAYVPGGIGSGTGGGAGRSIQIAAPGITATKVYVGLVYSSDESAGNRAIGATGAAASYDLRDVYKVIIDYANAHGGFLGRKIEPVYFNLSVAKNIDTQAEAACQYWTHDHHVFAMDALRSDILRECAEKAGAISLVGGDGVKSTFQRFPHFFDPNSIRLDRLGSVTVNGLAHAKYFAGKLGLVTWDDPNFRYAMANGYLPALAALGLKPAVPPVYVNVPEQVQELGSMTAAVSSAVTKFRAAGIDHVLIQDGPAGVWAGGGLTLEWMNQAESQHYRPRYGQNAYNLPGSSTLPAVQMDHAIAVMETDDDARYDEGWHANPARTLCYKLQAKAGFPVRSSNSGDESAASQACDHIFFIQQAINRLTTVLSNDTFRQSVESLGTSFHSAVVYGTRFGPDRHDGADLVRNSEYFKSCKCLKYQGSPYTPD